ncbi:MAG: hypothetical protein M3384_22100 [Acidobacteriota bacterium]|nr:hypothetical protein [Acidobacteriota bacterium]
MADQMKALELLRMQLVKDYPGDTPAFGKALDSPEEAAFFFENLVIPAFEKIKKEFDSFHFTVNVRRFPRVTRLDIRDGCSLFTCSIKISRKYACAILTIFYRDHSICSYNFEERTLLEERFDLSKIYQVLPEELIITIFSEIFINRRIYLKRLVETEENERREKEELRRETRRAKLINLKRNNEKFDPRDEFQKYLDSPEYARMMSWFDTFFDPEVEVEEEAVEAVEDPNA